MITVEQAVKNLRFIQDAYSWSTGADEALNFAIKCVYAHGEEMIKEYEEESKGWGGDYYLEDC